jgi:hypothetical protein
MLDPNDSTLHQRAHRIVTQRQRSTSFARKAAWALYRKNDLQNLVKNIADLTNQLVNLFLATKPRQQELSAVDVQELGDGNLPLIQEIVMLRTHCWLLPLGRRCRHVALSSTSPLHATELLHTMETKFARAIRALSVAFLILFSNHSQKERAHSSTVETSTEE